jgi:hypothetical protein
MLELGMSSTKQQLLLRRIVLGTAVAWRLPHAVSVSCLLHIVGYTVTVYLVSGVWS